MIGPKVAKNKYAPTIIMLTYRTLIVNEVGHRANFGGIGAKSLMNRPKELPGLL